MRCECKYRIDLHTISKENRNVAISIEITFLAFLSSTFSQSSTKRACISSSKSNCFGRGQKTKVHFQFNRWIRCTLQRDIRYQCNEWFFLHFLHFSARFFLVHVNLWAIRGHDGSASFECITKENNKWPKKINEQKLKLSWIHPSF